MNRKQIVEQAETMLALMSTLDANEVAQVLGTALVEHIKRCSITKEDFINMAEVVISDTIIYAGTVRDTLETRQ